MSINLVKQGVFKHRAQHISFLVEKNKVIAIGINSPKTNTYAHYEHYRYPSTHSELSAIKLGSKSQYRPRKGVQQSRRRVLINIRISREDLTATNSRPCQACLTLAAKSGIKEIYFTNNKGEFEKIKI